MDPVGGGGEGLFGEIFLQDAQDLAGTMKIRVDALSAEMNGVRSSSSKGAPISFCGAALGYEDLGLDNE